MTERRKLLAAGAVGALLVAHVLVLFFLASRLKEGAFQFSLVPILTASYLFGFRGLFVAVLVTLINVAFIRAAGNADIIPIQSAATGTAISLSLAVALSTISEMNRKIKRLNQELKEQALIDPLTRLHNRRYAHEVVAELAKNFCIRKHDAEVRKRGVDLDDKVLGLFLLDLDHFKKINDTYGHGTGDAVLMAVSEILRASIRFDDILLRWGGEEFVIVLVDTRTDYLPRFAAKIRQAVADARIRLANGKDIGVTVSIGFVQFPLVDARDVASFEQCLNLSDAALYRAKAAGRNRAVQLLPPANCTYPETMDALNRGDEGARAAGISFRIVE